jgi:hypothetical protein
MSLPTGSADFTALAPRAPGQLITSNDWNALVAATKGLQDTLNALSQAVDTQLTALGAEAQKLQDGLQSTIARVAALEGIVHQYSRVTLTAAQSLFAFGETAVISARVTDVSGQAVTFNNQNAPWVTFVATWGRLRAVPGFNSSSGQGDRTVTVQVNAQGLAQVRLQPDHTETFDVGFEDSIATTMAGTLPANSLSAAQIIRTSPTPNSAKETGALKFLSTEYDRTDSTTMRDYVDTYYQKYPVRVSGKSVVPYPPIWPDYRATVFCIVQNSNDVSAPDFGRASGAIQVAFRDWISPWYNLEYSFDTTTLQQTYRDRIAPKFTADLNESVTNVKNEVNAIVANQGMVRKQRDYRVIRDAMDQINLPKPPTFLNSVTQAVQSAIAMQQTVQSIQDRTAELPAQQVAFEVFTNAATRADTSVAATNSAVSAVQQQLSTVQASVTSAQTQMATLTNNLTAVGTRLDTALSDTGAVGSLRLQLNTVKTQVGAFSQLNPTDISSKLGAVSDLNQRVFLLETKK